MLLSLRTWRHSDMGSFGTRSRRRGSWGARNAGREEQRPPGAGAEDLELAGAAGRNLEAARPGLPLGARRAREGGAAQAPTC